MSMLGAVGCTHIKIDRTRRRWPTSAQLAIVGSIMFGFACFAGGYLARCGVAG